jgi:hypothetical protein
MTRRVNCGDSRKHFLSRLYEGEIILDPIQLEGARSRAEPFV